MPEGAACVAAAERLLSSGFLKSDEQIIIHNTGSGLKYLEAYAALFHGPRCNAHQMSLSQIRT